MSALIVVRDRSPVVHIVSDMGVFDLNGCLIGAASKIIQLPHLNAIAAVSGLGFHVQVASQILSICATSFSELKSELPQAAREILQISRRTSPGYKAAAAFTIAVAGLNERGIPDSFLVPSHAAYGCEPFIIVDLGWLGVTPGDSELLADVEAQPVESRENGDIDMVAFGGRIIERQRRDLFPNIAGKMVRQIGVAALLTTAGRGLITHRIIKRWPDQIGRPILETERANFQPH